LLYNSAIYGMIIRTLCFFERGGDDEPGG
jgi:hypothetical protein